MHLEYYGLCKQSFYDGLNFSSALSLFWGELVENGKPAADCYYMACNRIGFSPDEVVVFEDSENGCRAAVDAGTITIAVPGFITPAIPILVRLLSRIPSKINGFMNCSGNREKCENSVYLVSSSDDWRDVRICFHELLSIHDEYNQG